MEMQDHDLFARLNDPQPPPQQQQQQQQQQQHSTTTETSVRYVQDIEDANLVCCSGYLNTRHLNNKHINAHVCKPG